MINRIAFFSLSLFYSVLCFASVESSLLSIKTTLLGVILPIFAVIGVAFAAFSFFTGNVAAKTHLLYAMIGCAIVFGAQAIVDFISRMVR